MNEMCVENASARIDEGTANDCELEVHNGKYFIIHYINPKQYPLYIAVVECVLLDKEMGVDVVQILFMGVSILPAKIC